MKKTITIQAVSSFCGAVCMNIGETREVDAAVGESLIAAGFAINAAPQEDTAEKPKKKAAKK